jgi:hypothetical protein
LCRSPSPGMIARLQAWLLAAAGLKLKTADNAVPSAGRFGVALSNGAAVAMAVGLPAIAILAVEPLVRPPLVGTKHTWTCRLICPQPEMREVRKSAAYDHAMAFFRNAMGLFRSRAGKNREIAAAELPHEQIRTGKTQPEVAPREVKREVRPDPDKPGWGRSISL